VLLNLRFNGLPSHLGHDPEPQVTKPEHRRALPSDPDPSGPGNERACASFDDLFRANYPALVRFAYRLVGSRDAAEEIVQEMFLHLWRRRDEMDPTSVARAYLFTATRYGAVSWMRRTRIERTASERDDLGAGTTFGSASPGAADALEAADLETAIEAAIAALPERCRLVFTLHRREHMSYAAIAAALGLSVKTVEAQMARAFRHLRTRLAPYLGAVAIAAIQ
jgi:RNA polymerase sigma-70 factor (family 1)